MPAWLDQLNKEVITCTRCPRLVEHCRTVAREKRRAYREWEYWGKPVPGFGDPDARMRAASGSRPVKSRKAPAACPTAMRPPSSVRQPRARAVRSSSVSSGT